MGEAKRRQLANSGEARRYQLANSIPPPAIDDVREVGASFSQFERQMAQRGSVDVKVPCNGCTACCHHPRIQVVRAEEPAEHLAHLSLVPDPNGDMKLDRRSDGSCVHLGEQGCTVYAYRPAACRQYDCRVNSMVGIRMAYGDAAKPHAEPEWQFDLRTLEDQIIALTRQVMRVECSTRTLDEAHAYILANRALITNHIRQWIMSVSLKGNI